MRIVVIGSKGQVGSEVVRAAQAAGIETLELEHSEYRSHRSEPVSNAPCHLCGRATLS